MCKGWRHILAAFCWSLSRLSREVCDNGVRELLAYENILYSRKFSDGNIFGQSRISTFRPDFIFVQCCMLNARVRKQYACVVCMISQEQILVRN